MKQNAIKFKFTSGLFLTLFSFCAQAASSQMDSSNLFDSILNVFHSNMEKWGSTILNYASWLFWALALISMTWTFGFMMLQKADFQEFFRELIKFIVTLGFFFWIMRNGPAIATSIIDSLRQLAADASGLSYTISPSDIVDVGFDIVTKAIDNSSVWSPVATGIGIIVAGIILVILVMVAMNMLIILISGWVISYAGVFLLGFGGGRWTEDIAINYYRTVLGIALQAFSMILIIGMGKSFIDQYYALMSQDILLKEMFIMLVVAIVLLMLINKIPPLLAGIVHGGGQLGGGGGGPMGGMGMSGALGAAAAAGGIAAAGFGKVSAQTAGAMSAVQTAYKAASQTVGMNPSSNLTNQSATSNLGGLANAMGQATTFASAFGSHLGSGIASVAKDKKDAFKTSMSQKVSKTAGGKVASSISAKMGGESSAGQGNSDPTTNTNQEQTQSVASSSNQAQSAASGNVKGIKSTNGDISGGVGEGDEINLTNENKPNAKEG